MESSHFATSSWPFWHAALYDEYDEKIKKNVEKKPDAFDNTDSIIFILFYVI
jgi:hypothetical protein